MLMRISNSPLFIAVGIAFILVGALVVYNLINLKKQSTFGDIQQSHIQANVPAEKQELDKLLDRDLTASFKETSKKDVSVKSNF